MLIRSLTSFEECCQVAELEQEVWAYTDSEDIVPPAVLIVSMKRGGILLGAFDDSGNMRGFVYSMPAVKDAALTQWSHMLGVLDDHRNDGTGRQLKLLQRERTLSMGLDLIEWTYDPMQALNAHLNFARLGVIVEEYEVNVYGTSESPLHRGNPTDRFVAEWWIAKPHVERRLSAGSIVLRTDEVADAVRANRATRTGEWLASTNTNLALDERRLLVEIPTGFTEMLSQAPDLAMEWRMTTREIFRTYFGRGYRAVEFFLDRPNRKGAYLLARHD